jgi:hypothetical protein
LTNLAGVDGRKIKGQQRGRRREAEKENSDLFKRRLEKEIFGSMGAAIDVLQTSIDRPFGRATQFPLEAAVSP